tara:strand:- start:14139 stop:15107 length:969 start_codon:yes stop_codon:yes gene_type:complete
VKHIHTTEEKLVFIKQVFGPAHLMSDGVNAHVMCPSCGKSYKKKKFVIRLDNDLCHCFVCGLKSKNLTPILRKFFGREVALKYSKTFLGSDNTLEEFAGEERLVLPTDFRLISESLSSNDPDFRAAIKYLKERGIPKKDFWYYKFGLSFEGAFKRRIIMPSFDDTGNLNFFTARSYDDSHYMKYHNAKVNKTQIIFNDINIDWNEKITLVEGPFDLVKANPNSTCLLGSSLSRESLLFEKITKNSTPVVLALDADAQLKMIKIANLLYDYNIQVQIMSLGGKEDVGEMSRKEFNEAYKDAKLWSPQDSLTAKIKSLRTGSLL